jgi:hypothetical protein
MPEEKKVSPDAGQGNQALVAQLQAILAAQSAPPKAEAAYNQQPEETFNPAEQRQFARFGMDPKRLKFMNTLAHFRKGLNMERDLFSSALKGKTTPGYGDASGTEELSPFA